MRRGTDIANHNKRGLKPLLRKGLKIVFIGTQPGVRSLRCKCYYADRSNSFYCDLHDTKLTRGPRPINHGEYGSLLKEGFGLDDVNNNPYALKARLTKHKPKVICFNSKRALLDFLHKKRIKGSWAGSDARKHVTLGTFSWNPLIWALYDSSGRARAYHKQRIKLLNSLKTKII